MTTVTQSAAERLLADMARRHAGELDTSAEITVGMYAQQECISMDAARKRLNADVEAGLLTKRWATWRGCRVAAYRATDLG